MKAFVSSGGQLSHQLGLLSSSETSRSCQATRTKTFVSTPSRKSVRPLATLTSIDGDAVTQLKHEGNTVDAGPGGVVRWRPGGRGGRKRVLKKQDAGSDSEEEDAGHAKVLTWLQDDGISLTAERTLARVNRAISRCSSLREALAVVEEMKAAGIAQANEGTYQALITVCKRNKQGEKSLLVYEAMLQAGISPSLLTYNSLISCCQQAQRLEDAFKLKAEMQTRGVKPDVVTYTALMALVTSTSPYRGRWTPAQRFDRVMEVYREMTTTGVIPDTIAFNTLLLAAAQTRLPTKALDVYGMMAKARVPPNHSTFTLLLETLAKGGRLKAALAVFNEMRVAGIPTSTVTYNFVLEACAVAPQTDASKAWSLYEEMTGPPARDAESATADVTPSSFDPSTAPNADTFNFLIATCAKARDHDGALRAFDLMRQRGLNKGISTSTWNRLIHSAAASKEASTEKAFELYSQMCKENLKADVVTFGTLVSACEKDLDVPRAAAVWQEFKQAGVKANQAVYNAMTQLQGKAGDWQGAVSTFKEMKAACKPDPSSLLPSYTIVFDACFGRGGATARIDQLAAEPAGKAQALIQEEGVQAALQLYREAVAAGVFRHSRNNDRYRCDVRNATRTVAVVAVIDWLLTLREKTRARVTTDSTTPKGSQTASALQEGVNDAGNDIVNDGGDVSAGYVAVRDAGGDTGESEEREAGGEEGSEGDESGKGSSEVEGEKSSSGEKQPTGVGREGRSKESLPRDLLLVTGTARNPVSAEENVHGRWPKLYASMDKTLRVLGFKPKRFQTISFQALMVDRKEAFAWMKDTIL